MASATRYTLLLDDPAVQNLEKLQQAYALSTKADVFGLANRVLFWVTQNLASGHEVGRFQNGEFQPLLLPYELSPSAAILLGDAGPLQSGQRRTIVEAEASAPPGKKIRLFISYSHADRPFLDRLLIHLKPLERRGALDLWTDTRIAAGADWKVQIADSLAHANTAVLLVSADFLASDFVVNNELPALLDAAQKNGTRVLPLIVKPSGFRRDQTLSRFQAINDPSLPLIALDEGAREAVYAKVADIMDPGDA